MLYADVNRVLPGVMEVTRLQAVPDYIQKNFGHGSFRNQAVKQLSPERLLENPWESVHEDQYAGY